MHDEIPPLAVREAMMDGGAGFMRPYRHANRGFIETTVVML